MARQPTVADRARPHAFTALPQGGNNIETGEAPGAVTLVADPNSREIATPNEGGKGT